MTARREFLQLSLGASLAPLLAGSPTLHAAGNRTAASLPSLFGILYDLRRPGTLAWARELERICVGAEQGDAPTLVPEGVNGNIAPYWLGKLQAGWRQEARALAGTTGEDLLFQLRQLAWQYRLRVVWSHEHGELSLPGRNRSGDGKLLSWIIASPAVEFPR